MIPNGKVAPSRHENPNPTGTLNNPTGTLTEASVSQFQLNGNPQEEQLRFNHDEGEDDARNVRAANGDLDLELFGPPAEFSDPLANVLTTNNGSNIQLSTADLRSLSRNESPRGDVSRSSSRAFFDTRPTSAPRNRDEVRRRSIAAPAINDTAEWRPVMEQTLNVDQLLGLDELNKQLAQHRLRIFVGTWNVNGQNLLEDLKEFLFPRLSDDLCDVYAVGIQEGLPEFKNWEIALQKAIGLSHVLFSSEAVGTIHISLFLRRDLIWFCTQPLVSRLHLRLINSKNSKGFVACVFSIFGSSFMFVTSHLTAGEKEEKMDVRIDQLNRIYREVGIPPILDPNKLPNRFDAIDYVFWFGDFNFRLQESRVNVENTITEMSTTVDDNGESTGDHNFEKLLMWDQLRKHKTRCIIHDFNEHPITFLPTYKFDLNSDHYDRSTKQRTPSYTDRILFRSNGKGNPIMCRCYQSVGNIRTSDHRPVYAVFDVKIRPVARAAAENLVINAGDFNREIYISAVGLMRTEQALKKPLMIPTLKRYQSHICSIL